MPRFTARPLFNEGPGRFQGLRPGDPLVASETVLAVEAADAGVAAEQVFAALNRDERPNRRSERSLSVGDVVVLIEEHGRPTAWAVEMLGFRPVDLAGLEVRPAEGR